MTAVAKLVQIESGGDTRLEPPRVVAGTFDITLNLSDRRGIKMTGYVYSDDTPKEINGRVDQFQDVLDRQAIRSDIVNKEAQVVGHIQNLEAFKQSYEELSTKQTAGGKLTSQEKLGMANFEPGVKRAKEAIESLRAAIKAAHDKLAA
jgi:hypothetical protein